MFRWWKNRKETWSFRRRDGNARHDRSHEERSKSKDTEEGYIEERWALNEAHPSRRRFNYGAIQRLVKADFLETERSTPAPLPLKNLTRTTYRGSRISSSSFFENRRSSVSILRKERGEKESAIELYLLSFIFLPSFPSFSSRFDTSFPITDINKISRPVLIWRPRIVRDSSRGGNDRVAQIAEHIAKLTICPASVHSKQYASSMPTKANHRSNLFRCSRAIFIDPS